MRQQGNLKIHVTSAFIHLKAIENTSTYIYMYILINTFIGSILKTAPPAFDITTRYMRLVINADDVIGSPGQLRIGRQLYLFGTSTIKIDSENDNAQFRHEPASGGGFVAYPAGGVSQGDGQIEITLTTNMEVESGSETDFFRLSFKPDITD